MLVLLLVSMLTFSLNLQSVKASGTIYIRADGSIDPPTAPISSPDNITYTLNGDIIIDSYTDGIVVERDNIIVDGAGFLVQGSNPGQGRGINLTERSNVTISGFVVDKFNSGIWVFESSEICICNNTFSGNAGEIELQNSTHSRIFENNLGYCMVFLSLPFCSDTHVYHNNFIGPCVVYPIGVYESNTTWDMDYPSGGNYWSDYTGSDLFHGPYQNETGSDGIGDTPQVIDASNQDNYPLMRPYVPFEGQIIYIRSDGSVDPSGASVVREGDSYTLIGNISSDSDGIVIERSNMTLDGAGYTLKGSGSGAGISLAGRSNVTIKGITVTAFNDGVDLNSSSGNVLSGNNITASNQFSVCLSYSSSNIVSGNNIANNEESNLGVILHAYSSNNSVCGNNINSSHTGIVLESWASYNYVAGNKIADNAVGFLINDESSYNSIIGNDIVNNNCGIILGPLPSSNNSIFHNNLVGNTNQAIISPPQEKPHFWDDGYPSGGNYWSDYAGVDLYSGSYQNEPSNDGIGDTPYVIDANNIDHYPLMVPYGTTYSLYDWPMFHHDLNHTGYSSSSGPTTNQTLWTYTTGGYVYSSPAVADGRVYVGSIDDNVYCLNASNGVSIWNYATGDFVGSSPAVADGRVYVGSYDDNVYCLDVSTGAKIWNYTTGAEVMSSPAVAGGMVFVGSFDWNVYCLDAYTGAKIWNYTTGHYVLPSPAVADGRVYVGSDDCNVYCLDAYTGTKIWNYTTGAEVMSSPAVAGGMVFVGSVDWNVYCLDAYTGAKIWNNTIIYGTISSPTVVDGRVYIGAGDSNVYCLDASDGTKIWNYTTGGDVVSSPAVAGGMVYVGSFDDKVYCLDASDGAWVWSYTTGSGVGSSPAVADGRVYVGSYDNKTYAFGDVHDVAVTNVTTCKDGCDPFVTVGQNRTMHINVTVENQGNYTETFNVTVYANATMINQTLLVMPSATSIELKIVWNATLPYGNYSLSAVADTVSGEVDDQDNARDGSTVFVTIPGDIDGTLWVKPMDLNALLIAYGSPTNPEAPYNPNTDLNHDHKIGPIDLNDLLVHYGQHYP